MNNDDEKRKEFAELAAQGKVPKIAQLDSDLSPSEREIAERRREYRDRVSR